MKELVSYLGYYYYTDEDLEYPYEYISLETDDMETIWELSVGDVFK